MNKKSKNAWEITVTDALYEEIRFIWDNNNVDYLTYCENAVYEETFDF